MRSAPIPENEVERLDALRKLRILEAGADPALDHITQLASSHFGMPIASIVLIDSDRESFKSRVGLELVETPRDISFSGYAIAQGETFIVPDATQDPRFKDNPFVTAEPHIRFYAGQPLKGPDDDFIGTLSILDSAPRELSANDRLMLTILGKAAERVLLTHWESEQRLIVQEATGALVELTDTTAFGVITVGESGVIEEFNPGAEKIFGYSPAEAVGMTLRSLIPVRDRKDGSQRGFGQLTDEFSTVVKDRLVEAERKNGEKFPIALSVSEVFRSGRRRFSCLIFDMSELTAAQADRSAFFSLSVDLFCILDQQGNILRLNPAFLDVLGYSIEEMSGKMILDLIVPQDTQLVTDTMARVGLGEAVEGIEARCVCKDGSQRTLVWAGRSDPETGRIYASARDTTELVRLRNDIDRFFSVSLDLFCIVDTKGRFVRVNPAFLESLGYSEEELIGRNFLDVVSEEDRERANEAVAKQADGTPSVGFESRSLSRDGSTRAIVWTSRADPVSDLIYATGRDITAQKLREAELARLADIVEASADFIALFDSQGAIQHLNGSWRRFLELSMEDLMPMSLIDLYGVEIARELLDVGAPEAIRVGTWTGESVIDNGREEVEVQQTVLAHTLSGAENDRFLSVVAHDVSAFKEVERVKNEFISTVSHELRTPLTSIRGSLGLLDGGAMGELPDKAKAMVKIASQNTDRLVRLINDVLDLEKMSAGKFELRLEHEDIHAVVNESVEGVRGMADVQSIVLATEFTNEPLFANIDHDRIVQVVTNLLSNAIKFSPVGSEVKVTLGRESAEWLRMEVVDQGSGIPADKLDYVFDRFAQVDSTSTRSKGGTGLGLAIVQQIVEQHGGSIRVASVLGEGSTFTVLLPFAPEGSDGDPLIEQPAAVLDIVKAVNENSRSLGRQSSRLLVVEDDSQLAQVMVALLEGAGHKVTHAGSVAAARAALKSEVPDAILLDLKLPDGHGLDLLEVLRDDLRLRDVRVMVVSGVEEAPDKMPMPVVINWLRKPFTNREILDSIGVALDTRLRPSVLVVEDDQATREVIAAMLEAQGIDVRQAANGRQALDVIEDFRPDLIILDLHMPVMDGFEFMKARNPLAAADIPIVIYTGEDLTAAQQDALSVGLTTFLTKTRTSDDHFISAVMTALVAGVHEQVRASKDK